MQRLTRGSLFCLAAVLLVTLACTDAPADTQQADYEIWAMDQGTHVVHVFNPEFEELARIDMGALGVEVPHMIEFTSDHRYAFIAAPATGNTAVVRAEDYEVVAILPTGPRSHHAAVAPDDRTVLVSVIGAPDVPWDGRLVELEVNLEKEEFTIARELVLADDPVFAERMDDFSESAGVICLAFDRPGDFAYVTLGPSIAEGGVVVVDMQNFEIARVFSIEEVDANCGTVLSPDGELMYLIGGDQDLGVYHAIDTRTHEPVYRGESHGIDAHGGWVTPDGSEFWIVNRVTNNAVIVDTESMEIIHEIDYVGETPDIIAMSPNGDYVYATLRGPNPVTMAHLAVGDTPGISVIDIRTREKVRLAEPAQGNPASDFHGIAVRILGE